MTRAALWLSMSVVLVVLTSCGETQDERVQRRTSEQSVAEYGASTTAACDATRVGGAGYTESVRTPKGVPLTVVTPTNYDVRRPHPLLLVFAPAGISRFEVERVTGFTAPATRAGFIVAYAEHPPLGLETTRDLGHAATRIAQRWCIDAGRVFLAGHSDGGSVSHMLAVLPESREAVRGIAPSGAGVRAADLAAQGCPAPRPVMVSHAIGDKTFPGWGDETARWWAACNRCSSRTAPQPGGCIAFQGCAAGAPTWFCATPGGHSRWPENAQVIVDFFRNVPEG